MFGKKYSHQVTGRCIVAILFLLCGMGCHSTLQDSPQPDTAVIEIVSVEAIQAAQELISEHLPKTPCLYSYGLSRITGANVYLKLENMQATGAFKERGALNKLLSLTDAQRKNGVIAASTGNHAQGVSYHARRLNIPVTIVMPLNTPENKIERTKALGAQVVLEGPTFDEAVVVAKKLSEEKNLTFIHPYNDPIIIAGQGTVVLEMLEVVPQLDALIIPVGGGGLIAGSTVMAWSIKPGIQIFGVESRAYSGMKQRLNNKPVQVGGATLAEGMAVKSVGAKPLQIIRDRIEDILIVDEAHIEQAIALLIENAKTVAEGAGATPLAALLQYPDRFKGRNVGLVISGGNIDSYELAMVLLRSMAIHGQLVEIVIPILDHPDQLGSISAMLDEHGATIREIRNNIIFGAAPLKTPEMIFTVETHNWEHAAELIKELNAHKLSARIIRSGVVK